MQTTNTLLMIEPVSFGFNKETAQDNFFQINDKKHNVQEKALAEFKAFVKAMRQEKINIITIKDTLSPHTPDSIYPNNWITLQEDGDIVLYPMFAPNRRQERREAILNQFKNDFQIKEIVNWTKAESNGQYLEGTGSMIFDHDYKIAYGSISKRLDLELFKKYCDKYKYQPVVFHANQTINGSRLPIYHTNVMMCIAKEFAVICLESIDNKTERNFVKESIDKSDKRILEISEEQMHHFAGNMLQVQNAEGKSFMVMSKTAYTSLTAKQIEFIENYSTLIYSDLSTIERNGGGSARCMIAEVFLRPS